MNHDLYIFGSVVRGDVSATSDIDVLAICPIVERSIFPNSWSVYSENTIRNYFSEGRLFAWHLYLESICVYKSGSTSFIKSLGEPAPYNSYKEDISDLTMLLDASLMEIKGQSNSLIYELGIVYTAIRDIGMIASWILLDRPNFSRMVPYEIPIPCPLSRQIYLGAMLARHQSARGIDSNINPENLAASILKAPLDAWINKLRMLA